MLGNITKKIFGTPNDRYLKNSKTILEHINSLEGELEKLNDDELKKNTLKLKEKFISGESLESLLPLSFATVRETSKRILGQRHYDVQIIGGIAQNLIVFILFIGAIGYLAFSGKMAEMFGVEKK